MGFPFSDIESTAEDVASKVKLALLFIIILFSTLCYTLLAIRRVLERMLLIMEKGILDYEREREVKQL